MKQKSELRTELQAIIDLAEWGIANERLGGNVAKEEHWKGQQSAATQVLAWLETGTRNPYSMTEKAKLLVESAVRHIDLGHPKRARERLLKALDLVEALPERDAQYTTDTINFLLPKGNGDKEALVQHRGPSKQGAAGGVG